MSQLSGVHNAKLTTLRSGYEVNTFSAGPPCCAQSISTSAPWALGSGFRDVGLWILGLGFRSLGFTGRRRYKVQIPYSSYQGEPRTPWARGSGFEISKVYLELLVFV